MADNGSRKGQQAVDHAHGKAPSTMSFGALLQSVFAAALGVQSAKNRERDFNQGNAGVFIVAGLIFTIVFIGGVLTIVNVVLATK